MSDPGPNKWPKERSIDGVEPDIILSGGSGERGSSHGILMGPTSTAALDGGSELDDLSSEWSNVESALGRQFELSVPSEEHKQVNGPGSQGRGESISRLRGSPALSVHSKTGLASQQYDSGDSDVISSGSCNGGTQASVRVRLVHAVRKERWGNINAILNGAHKNEVRETLKDGHYEDDCNLLMIAAKRETGLVLTRLAGEIRGQLGTTVLVKQLREGDDVHDLLLFHAAASSSGTFVAAQKLLKRTLGSGGLEQQTRHTDVMGRNLLMYAARGGDNGGWSEVWRALDKAGWLEEQLAAKDNEGRGALFHAAGAGNAAMVRKMLSEYQSVEYATDNRGWTVLMHAARRNVGNGGEKVLQTMFDVYSRDREPQRLEAELAKVGSDGTSVLMHAALGGQQTFDRMRKALSENGSQYLKHTTTQGARIAAEAKLLAWAAEGGSTKVLNKVSQGIQAEKFEDAMASRLFDFGRNWDEINANVPGAGERIRATVKQCSQMGEGSLFMSAIKSGNPEMIKHIIRGIRELWKDREERWCVLCGFHGENEGNPLTLAAKERGTLFRETLKALEAECNLTDPVDTIKLQAKLMPEGVEQTPLYSAVCSDQEDLFVEVLDGIKKHFPEEPPGGQQIIQQISAALSTGEDNTRRWISARMLLVVLKVAKDADKYDRAYGRTQYDRSLLDDAVRTAIERNSFDHLRTLVKYGCHIVKQFPDFLSKIGESENISESICLAITAARNPFTVCSVALHDIRDSGTKYPMNRAALQRLEKRIVEIVLKLLEHLPGSVYELGAELARGDVKLEREFSRLSKGIRCELLGFVVMRWMLERAGAEGLSGDGQQPKMRVPLLVHAASSATDFLNLLSVPLVVDYLRLEFTRMLPAVTTADPFGGTISKTFYSYTNGEGDSTASKNFWQRLLSVLQGRPSNGNTNIPNKTILPGLQFILVGVIGKPEAFYPVPEIRMYFGVLCYLIMMGMFLSIVVIRHKNIEMREWLFYVIMAGVVCREALEFVRAKKYFQGPPSFERYFSDTWNFLDVASIFIVAVAFVLRLAGNGQWAQLFLAWSAPLLFSRVLFLSQIGSTLGPMTQVIFNMISELSTFSIVLLLVMLGFSTGFWALFSQDSISQDDIICTQIRDAFGSFGDSVLTLFSAMLGEFSFEAFEPEEEDDDEIECRNTRNRQAGVVLLVVYLIIMAVMLLNLLIAVLSTAHAAVYQDAEKQFHAARAKLIVQSRDDVLHDVLPPPFNLIKPVSGVLWPTRIAGEDLWDITLRTVHRLIFALVVGLTAVVVSNLLWIVSLPWVAFSLANFMTKNTARAPEPSTNDDRSGVTPDEEALPAADSTGWYEGSNYLAEENLERVFLLSISGERLMWSDVLAFLRFICCLVVGVAGAVIMCFVVYPALSILLWTRGLYGLWSFFKSSRDASPLIRKQMNLGEDGSEWDWAREQAIKKNESYSTRKRGAEDFNVLALLTTLTGLTMEDLRKYIPDQSRAQWVRGITPVLERALNNIRSELKDR